MVDWYVLDGKIPRKTQDTWEAMAFYLDRYKRCIVSETVGECIVSTVFLALDAGIDDDKPILFETMVLGGPLHYVMKRYCTYDEAEAGHKAMVKRVEEAQ